MKGFYDYATYCSKCKEARSIVAYRCPECKQRVRHTGWKSRARTMRRRKEARIARNVKVAAVVVQILNAAPPQGWLERK